MARMRLRVPDVRGIYGIMPTPAVPEASDPDATFTVDLEETRRGADQLVADGVDAIMVNGTFGEGPTLTDGEWRTFTQTVIETVEGRVPVLAGPTTLNTRDTIARAKHARELGAEGLLLGRPMWCELSTEATIAFYEQVADAVPELGIVVYHNPSAFKNRLSPATWGELSKIPQVVGAKYGTIDKQYASSVDEAGDRLRLMVIDQDWYEAYRQRPEHAVACWSGLVCGGPLPVTLLRDAVLGDDTASAESIAERIDHAYEPFYPDDEREFRRHTIPLMKALFDAAGYIEAGPARPPYHLLPDELAEGAERTGERWRELVSDLEERA